MSGLIGGIFNFSDRLKMESLDHRLKRSEVITANIANAETPGFRAIGYGFEEQLQAKAGIDEPFSMNVSDSRHFLNDNTDADGTVHPDVYVRPTESVGQDGNTVDVDQEMGNLAENQILYRATVELINRKVGMLRYAITSGGR